MAKRKDRNLHEETRKQEDCDCVMLRVNALGMAISQSRISCSADSLWQHPASASGVRQAKWRLLARPGPRLTTDSDSMELEPGGTLVL